MIDRVFLGANKKEKKRRKQKKKKRKTSMLYLLLLSVCVRLCFEREWNRVMGGRAARATRLRILVETIGGAKDRWFDRSRRDGEQAFP